MSVFNPSAKFQELPASTVWASLKSLDGKFTFDFLVNPETIVYSHNSNHVSLNVLRSDQPYTSFISSVSSLSIPKLYLWTPNSRSSINDQMATLKAMTKPTVKGGVPPLLSFTWGLMSEPRVYLTDVDFNISQWRSGTPTQAEGGMTLLISPKFVDQAEIKTTDVTKPTSREASKKKADEANKKVTDLRRRTKTEPVKKRDAKWRKDNGNI